MISCPASSVGRAAVPRVVGSSPMLGTNILLPNVTLLVSEVIRRSAWRLNDKGGGSVVKYGWDKTNDQLLK